MTMTTTARAKPKTTTPFGQRIIKSMRQSVAQLRAARRAGKRWPAGWRVRTAVMPDPPSAHAPDDLRKLRRALGGVDQRQFAALVGVSVALVASWETGRRAPSPLARRLLDEIARDPARWSELFGSKASGRRMPKSTRTHAA
jgi:DNA-binding transcriptional regulator YiaG